MATSSARPDRASAGRFAVADYGEGAVLLDLGIDAAPDRAARTHAAAAVLRQHLPAADVVVGAGTILVDGSARTEVLAILAANALEGALRTASAPLHAIPAVYDGPDLAPAAEALGLTREALIEWHAGSEVVVELLGFLPGFAYLGPIDPRLVLPRRPSPRPMVPAGSIGIAGMFTGIYPFASPGGWNLIARALGADAPLSLFDPRRDPPTLFAPGDRVRFEPVPLGSAPKAEGSARAPAEASPGGARGLRILAVQAGATLQDAGRPGQLHRGLPPSGALDPEALARANAAVGNPKGAAAIEIPLGGIEVEAVGSIAIAIDGEPMERLAEGERRRLPACRRAVRYLAVQGGIAVEVVLGARATLLVAKIGGLSGRPLRRGDFLPAGAADAFEGARACPMPDDPGDEALVIDEGPHLARFPAAALDTLLETEWRVSRLGDRVGVRLDGGRVPRDRPDLALPVPMRRGAVQVSTDGTPIVLGPDHPATGGYPVLAILRREAQAALARKRPGDAVRFRLA
jgi:KipI family sensor histidine kinase inhibitor